MTYIRSLFLNFLIVFFVNHVVPGINLRAFENVPNIGADLLFAIIVGLVNSLVFPILVLLDKKITKLKIAILSFIFSFGAYFIILIFPLPLRANFTGFIVAGLLVFLVSFFTNYLEAKHSYKKLK